MEYVLREISKPSERELSGICNLWMESFGDSESFIRDFYKKMPVCSTICCFCEDIPVSMAVLLSVGEAYYGYAVCTAADHRRKGLCRRIHDYIREKCDNEGKDYLVHPASDDLCGYYKRMGMDDVLSFYEITTISYDREAVCEAEAEDYFRIRDLYYGGGKYYPWSVESLRFMKESGITFLSAYIDGEECAAALDGDNIIELCAPDYLWGKASSAFIPGTGKLGKVRFICEANHTDSTAVMSFSGKQAYFNLFFE